MSERTYLQTSWLIAEDSRAVPADRVTGIETREGPDGVWTVYLSVVSDQRTTDPVLSSMSGKVPFFQLYTKKYLRAFVLRLASVLAEGFPLVVEAEFLFDMAKKAVGGGTSTEEG